MDLKSSVSQFASGAAIQDTVTPGLAGLSVSGSSIAGLSAIPGFDSLPGVISGMVTAAQAQWQAVLSQLPIALPAMKAVLIQEKKMEMADGGISSDAGSSSFNSYFGAIDSVKAKVAALQSSVASSITSLGQMAASVPGVAGAGAAALASLAGKIPTATIPDPSNPGQTIPNPDYTAFMSANGTTLGNVTAGAGNLSQAVATANADVQSQFAAASDAYKSGIGSLKAMAFASFCAQPQPKAVQDVINKTVNPSAIAPAEDFSRVSRSASTWSGTQTASKLVPATSPTGRVDAVRPTPANPPTYVPSACTAGQKAAISAQVSSARDDLAAASQAADAAAQPLLAWAEANNLAAAKNQKDSSPEALAQYKALRAQYEALPAFAACQAAMDGYKAKRARYDKLVEIQGYMLLKGPWPGNSDGPW